MDKAEQIVGSQIGCGPFSTVAGGGCLPAQAFP